MKIKLPELFRSGAKIKSYRKKIGMNQTDFWERIGITQSGGSRYERKNNLPDSVKYLLAIAYGTDTQMQQIIEQLRAWKDKV